MLINTRILHLYVIYHFNEAIAAALQQRKHFKEANVAVKTDYPADIHQHRAPRGNWRDVTSE